MRSSKGEALGNVVDWRYQTLRTEDQSFSVKIEGQK